MEPYDMTIEETGRWYGYPECCVQWFCDNWESSPARIANSQQLKVSAYRGFIPCPACATKVSARTLHTLLRNRQAPYPFPKPRKDVLAKKRTIRNA